MIARNKAINVFLSAVAVVTLTNSSALAQSGKKDYGQSIASRNSGSNYAARYSGSRFTSASIINRLNMRSSGRTGLLATLPSLGSYKPPAKSSKPFSTISRSPTVSPYLALNNSFNQVSDYYNIVRPQREQRRVNQQLQRQNQSNQRRLNKLAASGPYNPKGNQNAAPTGHSAVFQSLGSYLNTGGYFSGAPIPR